MKGDEFDTMPDWLRGATLRATPAVPGRPADDPPVAVKLSPWTPAEGPRLAPWPGPGPDPMKGRR